MKNRYFFHTLIATGFGTGFSPFAPGTAGAALALLVWYVISIFVSPFFLTLTTVFLIALFTFLGVWSSGVMEKVWGKDPSRVVVDEMVGTWITLLAVVPANLYYGIAAFCLFRLFDIFKPLGIRKTEAIGNGWGIMIDDILSGIYALLVLLALRWVVG